MANCAVNGPTTGDCKTRFSQTRRPFFGGEPGAHGEAGHHQARRDKESVGTDGVTDADDELRDQRQSAMHAAENLLEFRDEKYQQHREHDQRQHQQDARINHRGRHLRLQILFPCLEIGDLCQHHVEESARLAGFDHRGINARKSLRRFLHRIGQRHAVNDQVVDFLPPGLGGGRGSFLVKNDQRAAQGHARREQAGEQAREIFQVLRGNLFRFELEGKVSECRRQRGAVFRHCRRGLFGQADRAQAQRLHLPQRVGPARGVKLPLGDGAVALQGSVGKGGHLDLGKHRTLNPAVRD